MPLTRLFRESYALSPLNPTEWEQQPPAATAGPSAPEDDDANN